MGDRRCVAGTRLPMYGQCPVCDATNSGPCLKAQSLYRQARQLVEQQAKDDGLWFTAQTTRESYLQQELAKLHAAIECEEVTNA